MNSPYTDHARRNPKFIVLLNKQSNIVIKMSPSIEVLKFKATKSRDRPADVVKIEKVCPGNIKSIKEVVGQISDQEVPVSAQCENQLENQRAWKEACHEDKAAIQELKDKIAYLEREILDLKNNASNRAESYCSIL